MEPINDHLVALDKFRLIVPRIHAVLVLTRCRGLLSAIDTNRLKIYRSVAREVVSSVLPLHDARRTSRISGVGYGTIVRFFVVAIRGERVRYAGQGGFSEAVGDRVVKGLYLSSAAVSNTAQDPAYRTGNDFSRFRGPCSHQFGILDALRCSERWEKCCDNCEKGALPHLDW